MKKYGLDSMLSKMREGVAGKIQVGFTGVVKPGNKTTYSRSESVLEEISRKSDKYYIDSSLEGYSRDDLFYKPISFLEKGQFEKLSKLYNILPEAVPLPITKVRNKYGKEIGYIMKKVKGETLTNYLMNLDEKMRYGENERVVTELTGYVGRLSANGVGHGDIHRNNILLYAGKPYLIDPFAIGNCDNWYAKRDVKALKRLKAIKY